jgi:hypothetical protein
MDANINNAVSVTKIRFIDATPPFFLLRVNPAYLRSQFASSQTDVQRLDEFCGASDGAVTDRTFVRQQLGRQTNGFWRHCVQGSADYITIVVSEPSCLIEL